MNSTLQKRILIFSFLILTLFISLNTAFNIHGFRRDYRDSIILRARSLAEGLGSSIEKVLALGVPVEDMEGVNARCQEMVANDPEIIYCLVENTVGTPLYSNDPSFHFATGGDFEAALNETTTVLEFSHLGTVFDISKPIRHPDGDVAGRVRLGFPKSVLDAHTFKALERSVVILVLALALVVSLVYLFARRDVVGPIERLRSVARKIASGNFDVAVPEMPTEDFNELGLAVQEMADSLKERDERIRQGYQELERTNLELQKTYEHQEQISGELGRSREMYRSLLEYASDAILVSDEQDQIVLINKTAEAFLGVSAQKTVDGNLVALMQVLQVEDPDQLYGLHERALKGETVEGEMRFVHPGDQRRLIGWVRGAPVVGKNGACMVQTIIRDVTREREVKENLERSTRELERLNQMKDSFLGVASHELKTPLTVIIGYADLILGEMSDKLDPAVLNMIQQISDASERLSNIVRDMVDVSMLDSKRLPLKCESHDPNELVRESVKEVELFFSMRKLSLQLELHEELPQVYCDPERIVQAVGNLVGNAVKFTPDGGTITVFTRVVRSLRPPQAAGKSEQTVCLIDRELHPYVEIVIRDTGIGIAPKDQVHIFDKFYEVGSIEEHFTGKTAFKGKGAGLGLTIAKGIVNMHEGEVWVESPGHDVHELPGSSFHILLPIEQTERHKRPAKAV